MEELNEEIYKGFQFQKVQLKLAHEHQNPNEPIKISIPEGTIKAKLPITILVEFAIFQFQKIQLKLHLFLSRHNVIIISIPEGTIKAISIIFIAEFTGISIPEGTIKALFLQQFE